MQVCCPHKRYFLQSLLSQQQRGPTWLPFPTLLQHFAAAYKVTAGTECLRAQPGDTASVPGVLRAEVGANAPRQLSVAPPHHSFQHGCTTFPLSFDFCISLPAARCPTLPEQPSLSPTFCCVNEASHALFSILKSGLIFIYLRLPAAVEQVPGGYRSSNLQAEERSYWSQITLTTKGCCDSTGETQTKLEMPFFL